jgi:hypothetical protein
MMSIQRLRQNQIQNGLAINAGDINAELDQLVSNANSQETTVQALTTENMTVSGVKTFNNGLKTDTIQKITPASSVTIESVSLKDGTVRPLPSTIPTTPDNGMLWYNSTTHLFQAQHEGQTRAFLPFPRNYLDGAAPTYVSASQINLPCGLRAMDETGVTLIDISPLTGLTLSLGSLGAGGLDIGSEAANTFYYVWLCKGSSGVSAVLSASVTNPALPTGFNTYRRRLPFAIRNDASSNIVPFGITQGWPYRPTIQYELTISPLIAGGTPVFGKAGLTATTFTALDFSDALPATIATHGLFYAWHQNAGPGIFCLRTDATTTNLIELANESIRPTFFPALRVTSTRTVQYRLGAATACTIGCLGYVATA